MSDTLFDGIEADEQPRRTAVISDCGLFRYRLTRTWDETLPKLGFVMLNPSTADAEQDDPTIRRCVGFAKREACGGIIVVNLYAFRSTDPAGLKTAVDAVGPDNDRHIGLAIDETEKIVMAWGKLGPIKSRAEAVLRLVRSFGREPHCLGKTKDGHPRHPLMLRNDAALVAV